MHQDLKELQKLIGCRLCEKTLNSLTVFVEDDLCIELCKYCTDFYNSKIEGFKPIGAEKSDRISFCEGRDEYHVRSSTSLNINWLAIRGPFDITLILSHRALLDEIDDFCK